MNRKLIYGGTIVDGISMGPGDIVIEGEKIAALGAPGEFDLLEFDEKISAKGLIVMPGLVDPHLHFDSPFMGGTTDHDFYTGTKAAAYGGVTSVVSFSTQDKGSSILEHLNEQEDKIEKQVFVDWSIHGILHDSEEKTLSQIPDLIAAGIPTYKGFTTYRSSGRYLDDSSLLVMMEKTSKYGGMLMLHCEEDASCEYLTKKAISNGNTEWIYHALSRPALSENMAIQRVVDLMKIVPAQIFIVHASTAESVKIISQAQLEGLPIKCETCTHYLLLEMDKLREENGHLYICSPPLRRKDDRLALWRAAKSGPIDLITSDDAGLPSVLRTELANGSFANVPSGMPGIEPRLTLLYSEGVRKGHIDWPRLVELTSTNPAKVFGMYPQKGNLFPGADGDITMFDPKISWTMKANTLHMNTDFCPFEGWQVFGKTKKLISRGTLILDEYKIVGKPGHGKRIFRRLSNTN